MSGPDLSEFEKLSGAKRGVCKVRAARSALDDDGGARLDAALAALNDPACRHTHKGVERWLADRGHDVPWQSIRTHCNRECACHAA